MATHLNMAFLKTWLLKVRVGFWTGSEAVHIILYFHHFTKRKKKRPMLETQTQGIL